MSLYKGESEKNTEKRYPSVKERALVGHVIKLMCPHTEKIKPVMTMKGNIDIGSMQAIEEKSIKYRERAKTTSSRFRPCHLSSLRKLISQTNRCCVHVLSTQRLWK